MSELDELWRAEYEGLVRLARLLLAAPTGGEDVVQDAFARVVARPGGLEGVVNPGGYLRAAVVNACRSEVRHREVVRRNRPEPPDPVLPTYLVEFADALGALSERQRAAVVLRHHCDLPDAEIARILGCRRATVRSLVRRGLASLREVIEL